jgi:protease-4
MDDTYATFLARVGEGRRLDSKRLSAVAEGRIMSGRRAREGGLVDTAGGLPQALARARSKAGLATDASIEVWPKQRSIFERASEMFSGASTQASPLRDTLLGLPELATSPFVVSLVRGDAGPWAALPYALSVP